MTQVQTCATLDVGDAIGMKYRTRELLRDAGLHTELVHGIGHRRTADDKCVAIALVSGTAPSSMV